MLAQFVNKSFGKRQKEAHQTIVSEMNKSFQSSCYRCSDKSQQKAIKSF